MSDIMKAFEFAKEKHKGQVDKSGKPYIFHPVRVSNGVETDSEKVVAILHDVLEDTDATVKDLLKIGVSLSEIDAVVLLTKEKNEPYMEYIKRLSKNDMARHVKMSDLRHNMDMSRIENPTEKDYARLEKYKKAYNYLNSVEMEVLKEKGKYNGKEQDDIYL